MQNSFPSGVGHRNSSTGTGLAGPASSQRHDLADCLVDVRNDKVEVTSVLHHLSFGDLLQFEECRRAERIDGEPPFFTPERSGIFSDQRAPKSRLPALYRLRPKRPHRSPELLLWRSAVRRKIVSHSWPVPFVVFIRRWHQICANYPSIKTGTAAGQWRSSQSSTWETGEILPISFGAVDSRPFTFTGWAGGVARPGSPGA